jgi:hypothetical protein
MFCRIPFRKVVGSCCWSPPASPCAGIPSLFNPGWSPSAAPRTAVIATAHVGKPGSPASAVSDPGFAALLMNKLVEVSGFPPIPQKTWNGWGAEMIVHFSHNSTRPVRYSLCRFKESCPAAQIFSMPQSWESTQPKRRTHPAGRDGRSATHNATMSPWGAHDRMES